MGSRPEWDRYGDALRVARRLLRRYGRQSIDGFDAHDFAVESLRTVPWRALRVRYDILDAMRRERGRRGSRTRVWDQWDGFSGVVSRKGDEPDPEWLSEWWFLSEAQRDIAVLVARGLSVARVAEVLEVSQAGVYRQLRSIERKAGRNMPFKSQAQRGWMYANEPEMAKKWEKETPKGKKLPKRAEEKKWKRK